MIMKRIFLILICSVILLTALSASAAIEYLTLEELNKVEGPATVHVVAKTDEPQGMSGNYLTSKTTWRWKVKSESGSFLYSGLSVNMTQYQEMSTGERSFVLNHKECDLEIAISASGSRKVTKVSAVSVPLTSADIGPLLLKALGLCALFVILMLIFFPIHGTGGKSQDRYIEKTRLLAVNGIEYTTHKGLVGNAILGHMVAGDIGALIGAMSSEQRHTDNEFTFLVYYNGGRKGRTKETEKVRQSSARFQVLVSKLEDYKRDKDPPKQRENKPTAAPLPAPGPRRNLSDTEIKTILVPVGDYIVGEDIPAGSYTLSSDEDATVYIYRNVDDKSYDETYSCKEPSYTIGKIILKAGMRIKVLYGQITFTTFSGIKMWDLMKAKSPVLVYTGEYIVGEDMPAGSYTLTSTKDATIYIYESVDSRSYDDSYGCEGPNYVIGKVSLKDGMRILVHYSDMTFSPFKGLGKDTASHC